MTKLTPKQAAYLADFALVEISLTEISLIASILEQTVNEELNNCSTDSKRISRINRILERLETLINEETYVDTDA